MVRTGVPLAPLPRPQGFHGRGRSAIHALKRFWGADGGADRGKPRREAGHNREALEFIQVNEEICNVDFIQKLE